MTLQTVLVVREYIDIEARKALKAEVRYLVPVVQLYSGFGRYAP